MRSTFVQRTKDVQVALLNCILGCGARGALCTSAHGGNALKSGIGQSLVEAGRERSKGTAHCQLGDDSFAMGTYVNLGLYDLWGRAGQ